MHLIRFHVPHLLLLDLLAALLPADGLKLAEAEAGGMFRVAQYGAVHTLEARVNEMMLAVAV
jgi:hypothetical protein